jgi:hypothetical protein
MRRVEMRATVLALLVMLFGAGQTVAASLGPWQAVKAVSARFHSFDQALAAGYSVEGEPCVASPAGAMGIHAVNRVLTSDLDIDPYQPELLLYLPTADGRLELIGVEYFAVALANSESGPIPWFGAEPPAAGWFNPAPSVLGQTFDGPMPGHNPQMPWHYDIHAWLWASNPAGTFAPFNPTLSCP